jgi:hypothetical protein
MFRGPLSIFCVHVTTPADKMTKATGPDPGTFLSLRQVHSFHKHRYNITELVSLHTVRARFLRAGLAPSLSVLWLKKMAPLLVEI